MYIEKINGPEDVKKLSGEELKGLAQEMRDALLKRASIHGGHFGPNFGMVEATIALHYVFESPKDKIIYDVSHQTYPHKMPISMRSIMMMSAVTAIHMKVSMTTLSSDIPLPPSALPAVWQKQGI